MLSKNLVPGNKRSGMGKIFFRSCLYRVSKIRGDSYPFPGLVLIHAHTHMHIYLDTGAAILKETYPPIPWVLTKEEISLVDSRFRRLVVPHGVHAFCTFKEGLLENRTSCWRFVTTLTMTRTIQDVTSLPHYIHTQDGFKTSSIVDVTDNASRNSPRIAWRIVQSCLFDHPRERSSHL